MMEDNSAGLRSKKFRKLTKAICGLVSYNYKDLALSQGIDKYWYNIITYIGIIIILLVCI